MKKIINNKIFNFRLANEKDIDIINNFDKYIYKTIDKRFYFRHTKIKLKNMLKQGKIFLLFDKEKLIAWSSIILKLKESYLSIYGLPKNQINNTGVLVATAVKKRYRGNGIQSFMIKQRIEYLKKRKRKYALISAHPENKASINNIQKNNFNFVKKGIDRQKNINYYYLLKI
jgi:ribosomal protein S18 acetylase RimI-like enzyme